MLQIQSPFQQLFDLNGSPLDDGYVYIGVSNLNPESNPISIYWDDSGTIPASQPIRTLNGYIVRNGTPARVYTSAEDFSMTVKDKQGRIVVNVLDATSASNLATSLSSSSGSSLVGFIQGGTGAVARTVQSKMREIVSVQDFGAVGNGVADDTDAIAAAIAYVSSIGGGCVMFPPGVYACSYSLTVPNYVVLKGYGKKITTLLRKHSNDFISSFGGFCGIEDLTIDGQSSTYLTGNGVVMSNSTSPASYMHKVEITNFPLACLKFLTLAGSTFRAILCDFYTTGTVGSQAAVQVVSDVENAATSRHFTDCESKGCTLYDFGGASDFYVTGGYSNGLIFNANSSKVMITNMRIGGSAGTVTVAGSSHQLRNCVFAVPVILTCSNTQFFCEVPDFNITDNGQNNDWFTKPQYYVPTWTSNGATQPSLGNGLIRALWSRNGRTATVSLELSFGTTTTAGTGDWFFSCPPLTENPYAPVQHCGSGYVTNSTGSAAAVFSVRKSTTGNTIEMFYPSLAGASTRVGGTAPTSTWGAGSYLRLSYTYFVGP
jgi:hypothetical protein